MLDQAISALAKYDWGQDPKVLQPIHEAIVASHGNAAARKELEETLAAVLKSDASRDAKDYVCRKLMIIGTAASVPALAELLANKDLSHMARYALERITAPEAAQALRDGLAKVSGALKLGVIGSLGARRDQECVASLAGLLGDSDAAVAQAAAHALGAIRCPSAATALAAAKPAQPGVKQAVTDASLSCAEALLAAGQKNEALSIYKSLAAGDPPKHVRLAATRGMLACAGKRE